MGLNEKHIQSFLNLLKEHLKPLGEQPTAIALRQYWKDCLEISAPLASIMGRQDLKESLEDEAFEHLYPKERRELLAKLERWKKAHPFAPERILEILKKGLEQEGLAPTITNRVKASYSLWRKMKKNSFTFEDIHDLLAFRILVDTTTQCYKVMGTVQRYFEGTFEVKDYIHDQKDNGYRSIHIIVQDSSFPLFEVQVRTHTMHKEAERGLGAHWRYKLFGEKF